MSPHATPTIAAYIVGSLARLPAIFTDPTTTGAAAVLGVLSWMVGTPNIRLLNIVLGAMLINLAVGSAWAVINPHTKFCFRRLYGGIAGKVFRLMLIPVASLADQLFIVSPFGAPNLQSTFPIVAFVMWALAIAEIVSSLKKFVDAGIVPGALSEIIDRLQAAPGPRLPAPPRRDAGGDL